MPHYLIIVEQDPPRGDLYELEQTTWHRVVDAGTGETVLEFRGDMQAALSRDDGMWDDCRFTGVSEVILAPDERSALVKTFDGFEETVLLPQ